MKGACIMDFLRNIWPTPFKISKGDGVTFVIQLVVFVVACALIGWLIGVLAGIPIIGLIFKILGSLLEVYGIVGIVLCLLRFFGVC